MQRTLTIWLFLLSLICASAAPAQQIFPQFADVYVDDFGELLGPEDEQSIRQQLIALYDKTGIEAVLVTVPSLARYRATEISAYTQALFNTWGVGNKSANNGVMVLISKTDRKLWITVGDGIGHSLDADLQDTINTFFLPPFRTEHYPAGIHDGITELVRQLEVKAGVLAPPNFFEKIVSFLQHATNGLLAALAAILGALGFAASWLYQQWSRSRPRFCPADGARMDLLSESADDAKLEHGQTVEESVGSVDYDVWSCPKCQHVTVERYSRWFSSYGACKSCNYRTLQGTTTVLNAATTSSSGLKRIDYHCANCSAEYSVTQTIPRLSSSSGSGSSRSSFGGGRSSGGGAGGSW